MYPVRLGYNGAVNRIQGLLNNGHYAEALVTAVFTVEKTLYRTLKYLIRQKGFSAKEANVLLKQFEGMERMRTVWPCFDSQHEGLPAIIGNKHWQIIPNANTMRNRLVHGNEVYKLSECESTAKKVLDALEATRIAFEARYSFNGWGKITTSK